MLHSLHIFSCSFRILHTSILGSFVPSSFIPLLLFNVDCSELMVYVQKVWFPFCFSLSLSLSGWHFSFLGLKNPFIRLPWIKCIIQHYPRAPVVKATHQLVESFFSEMSAEIWYKSYFLRLNGSMVKDAWYIGRREK